MRRFYKKWWFWAAVLFVLVGAVGSSFDRAGVPERSPASSLFEAVEATAAASAAAEPPPSPAEPSSPAPSPSPEPEPSPSPEPDSSESFVWIPVSGSKYHSGPDCSNMKNPSRVTLEQAEEMGYEPCKKCFGQVD